MSQPNGLEALGLSPSEYTLPRLVDAAAARFGSSRAIEDEDGVFDFAGLAAAARRSAAAFVASGIRPGDRVAIWAPNSSGWIVAASGLQAAGAVLVPLNTRWKGPEVAYVISKSGARACVTVGEFLGTRYVEALVAEDLPELERIVTLDGMKENATPWEAFLSEGDGIRDEDVSARARAVGPDDLADMMFTSGTTGRPKGVMTTHAQNLRVFEVWSRVVGLREGDRYLIVNPFFHTFGYKAGWMSAILRGATILPHAVFDAHEVLERVSRDRVSVLPGPPALYQSFLAHPALADYDLGSLRLAVTGAAPTPVELIERMRDDLGFETVLTAYGLTESTGTVSMCRPEDDPETIATTSGRAIPEVEVRCIDAKGHEVARGDPGEVVVRGYNVMKGYFEDPEATAEAIDDDGWLHTGDVAVMDDRGYLRITDRIKDMFIVGGFNCYPAEIESQLFEHPDVAQAAVIGIPDERMGEVGMAFVVPAPGASPSEESIVAWCREHMANYKVPRRVQVVDALPMTASGKVTKFVLREHARVSGDTS